MVAVGVPATGLIEAVRAAVVQAKERLAEPPAASVLKGKYSPVREPED